MDVPQYIKKHIEANNKLLIQASKHADIVLDWYNKQLEKMDADESEIPCEEFIEIKNNWESNGVIDLSAIVENLNMLENEDRS